jgi:hypothetical protein
MMGVQDEVWVGTLVFGFWEGEREGRREGGLIDR